MKLSSQTLFSDEKKSARIHHFMNVSLPIEDAAIYRTRCLPTLDLSNPKFPELNALRLDIGVVLRLDQACRALRAMVRAADAQLKHDSGFSGRIDWYLGVLETALSRPIRPFPSGSGPDILLRLPSARVADVWPRTSE